MGELKKDSAKLATISMSQFTITEPKPYKGVWILAPGVEVAIYKVPNWFHRLMMKIFFGWRFKNTSTKQLLLG